MFAHTCFTGFESAALYGEEVRLPTRSIPRATFASVLLIGGFYLFTAWITVGAIGAQDTQSMARAEGGELMFTLLARFTRPERAQIMGVLVCTLILASHLAAHNAATRYLFALGREKFLPTALGKLHARRYAPSNASLAAKPAIERFTPSGAVFADGAKEVFDLVLFATGYDYRIRFIDEALFTWRQGRPELYLNIFHRTLQGLSVVGFVEFASAGYQRFDEMAQMTAMDAYISQSGQGREAWTMMKAEDHPNLRGSMRYVDSPRHANYVDVSVYRRLLSGIRERFGMARPR